ncbi:MAG: hypothetical protein RR900_00030 [Ruthenibacterium sp.]
MNRIKQWLVRQFLPCWAKETLLEDNQQLRRQLADAQQKNKELSCYIEGMACALRLSKVIVNGGERDECIDKRAV